MINSQHSNLIIKNKKRQRHLYNHRQESRSLASIYANANKHHRVKKSIANDDDDDDGGKSGNNNNYAIKSTSFSSLSSSSKSEQSLSSSFITDNKNPLNQNDKREEEATSSSLQFHPEKEYKSNLNSYHNYNSYSYQYQQQQQQNRYNSYNNFNRPGQYEYIRLKLIDLINPNRNKTFIDNLYAQFQSNSKQINLIYLPPNSGGANIRDGGVGGGGSLQPPENSILLNDNLFSRTNSNNLADSMSLSTIDSNKLLNEFYLTAAKQKANNFYEYRMPELVSFEIFLIYFVVFLWLLTVFICYRRYSLFICHHKNDVPFFDHSLVDVKLIKSRPTSPHDANINGINNGNHSHHSCLCNPNDLVLLETNETNINSNNLAVSNNVDDNTNISNSDEKTNSLTPNTTGSLKRTHDDTCSIITKPSSYLLCKKCNIQHSFSPLLLNQMQRDIALKSYSNGNFNHIKRYGTSFNKSSTTQTGCLRINNNNSCKRYFNSEKLPGALNFSFNNKFRSSTNNEYIWQNRYYYSNGVICANTNLHGGSYLNKSRLTSNKSSYNSVSTTINNFNNNGINKTKAIQLSQAGTSHFGNTPQHSQQISDLNLINENRIYDDDKVNLLNIDIRNNISHKRSILRNKHHNLMSLDENALHSYRKQHRINQIEHQMHRKKLIAKTNLSVINAGNSQSIHTNTFDMDDSNVLPSSTTNNENEQKEAGGSIINNTKTDEEVTTTTTTTLATSSSILNTGTSKSVFFKSKNTANNKPVNQKRAALTTPHTNFISLRSDTSNHNENQSSGNNSGSQSWMTMMMSAIRRNENDSSSYDYMNADFSDGGASNSPLPSPKVSSSHLTARKSFSSSNPIQNNSLLSIPLGNISNNSIKNSCLNASGANTKNLSNPTYNYSINDFDSSTLSAQNANPSSSMRRKMFMNSKYKAQTNVDYANISIKLDDSIHSDPNYDFFNSVNETGASDSMKYSNNCSSYGYNNSNNNFGTTNSNLNEPRDLQSEQQSKQPHLQLQLESSLIANNELNDSNYLNPSWIPLIVRRTLLEIHERAVLSKSESNIRNKYRSSNHLLHSPTSKSSNNNGNTNTTSNANAATSVVNNKINSFLKSSRKKKSLSLQNSHEKTIFNSITQNHNSNVTSAAANVSPNSNNNNNNNNNTNSKSNSGSYLNSFYDELRSKLFQTKTSSSNAIKPDSKQSIHTVSSSSEKSSTKSSFDTSTTNNSNQETSSVSNATVILNPNYVDQK